VDTSDVVVGKVLLPWRKDGLYLPNAIFLKRLTTINKNYPQFQKNDLPYCYLSSMLMYMLSIRGVY
jgi:hypothetical protein